VNLRDRLNGIDINFDDLQSGVEAGSRQAEHIHSAASNLGHGAHSLQRAELVAALSRHAKELRQCVRDQQGALQELRNALARLREELTGPLSTVRPLPANAADRRRR
jgi:phage-related minor tail protein